MDRLTTSLAQGLEDLEALCARTLQEHKRQQEVQQQEEQTAASELRRFLTDAGLAEQDESLDQGLRRLEEMTTEALQQPPATSSNTQG